MKRTVLISSTILAIITVLEFSQASQALPNPETVAPTVNQEIEVLFKSNQSMRRRRCIDTNGGGGRYPCPGFGMPVESEE